MRTVAYVSTDPGIPVFGRKGASVHIQAVLRRLVARGHDVHLLTPRPGGSPPPELSAVTVHPLRAVEGADPATREAASRRSDREVWSLLERIDRRAPVGLVYERYALWGRTATEWAAEAGVPSVLEVNAPLPREQAQHRSLVDAEGADEVARTAFAAAGCVVCVSDPVAEWVRSVGAPPSHVHTVPNGVDCRRVRPVPVRTDPSPFTIGFVGTLKPWHGVDSLVRAVALLRDIRSDYRLLVVGDGPERGRLVRLAASLGVADAVEMTGAVDPADIPGMLSRMDVAVAPYPALTDFYFSPLKVYEYLAAGLPTVASDLPELRRILEDGRLGLLTAPGDEAALARAVASLRDDPRGRERLAERGRETALRRHDWDHVVSRILGLVEVSRAPLQASGRP
jgi:glycosyltransferase involved in cell wall biosynthesis